MAANTALEVSASDFDEIKASLKTFLQSQSILSDYDFEDSTMNILLNLLAKSAYDQSFYLNMHFNEMFLESAIKRENAVSRAKELNYTPRSARGASAIISLTITPDDSPTSITIAKNTEFTTVLDNVNYTFVIPQNYVITPSEEQYQIEGVTIKEGQPFTHRYTVDGSLSEYEIPNLNVDETSIEIQVQESSGSSTTTTYTKATDLSEIDGDSKVYFLSENYRGFYAIRFGDNVLGNALVNGNIISIKYRICNGPIPNGATGFTPSGSVGGYNASLVSVATTTAASGGQNPEDIESIKFNAPLNYETQGRAVTAKDYERIIIRDNADLETVAVWGGETNDPPVYGKVYISTKPTNGTIISTVRKEEITTQLKKRNVLSIDPVFVDPQYMYINPTVKVHYNPSLTTVGADGIATIIATKVAAFETANLSRFDRDFKYSRFLRTIDDSDRAVVSSSATLRLEKRFTPTFNPDTSYTLNYKSAFDHDFDGHLKGVSSTGFYMTITGSNICYLDDDGYGNIRIFYIRNNNRIYVYTDAGTVDYTNGVITLNYKFFPTSIVGSEMSVYAKPQNFNITPVRNQILLIAKTTINVYNSDSNTLEFTASATTSGDTTTTNDNLISSTVTI